MFLSSRKLHSPFAYIGIIAFLQNPPILLLDEATSALDNESERLVQKSLEELAKGRTCITVAHRLTTIQGADRIVYLSENGIEEIGNHNELMDKKGAYFRLYNLYAKEGVGSKNE